MIPVRRREIFAWSMYDFANSAFATVVLTAIFPVFFQSVLYGDDKQGLVIWGYVVAISTFIVAVSAPLIGAISDTTAGKKRFLFCFWITGCICAGTLGLFGKGQWIPAAGVFILANIGFAGGNALYNSFLPELATREKMDRISGLGWGLGYLGGGLCLALTIPIVTKLKALDWALVLVGAWWFLFAIPFFLMVKERAKPVEFKGSRLSYGFRRVVDTLKHIRKYRELSKFLIAFLLYSNGIETVIVLAAGFGKAELGMTAEDLILCLLLIQGVALIGSFLFGWLAEKISSYRALIGGLVIWIAVIIWAAACQTRWEFWTLGVIVGTVLGGTQAVSRSMMGKFTPKKHVGEFFGFYAIGGKFAAVLGPAVFSMVSGITGSTRIGVLSVALFCVAGIFMLRTVDDKKGFEEAEAAS